MKITGNEMVDTAIFFDMLEDPNQSPASKKIDALIIITIFGCGAVVGIIESIKWIFR